MPSAQSSRHRCKVELHSTLLTYEMEQWEQGFKRILGMDEVGRGSLAGPVMVAGVILPRDVKIYGVNDSKLLTAKERHLYAADIRAQAISLAVAERDAQFIDEHGVVAAVESCQLEIIELLSPDYLLLDAFALPEVKLPQQPLIKGDQKSLSIAAASIIAKVTRDAYMCRLDSEYPHYGLAANKGYGTPKHRDALEQHGASPLHRQSFLGFLRR